jgi:hypothetical protein
MQLPLLLTGLPFQILQVLLQEVLICIAYLMGAGVRLRNSAVHVHRSLASSVRYPLPSDSASDA